MEIPKPGTGDLLRFPTELRSANDIFNRAVKSGCTNVIFTSVTSPGLLSIKLLLKKFPSVKCTVIPHGILESVINRPSVVPWEFIFWFRFALVPLNTDQLSYLLLGDPIKKRLCEAIPSMQRYLKAITLPTFYKDPQQHIPFESGLTRIGIFGVARYAKGFDLFFKIAGEVTACKTRGAAEFILIGHIIDEGLKQEVTSLVKIPSPDKPLSRDEFDEYARNIDYSIYFYKPTSYQLTASGALFDAFSYAKPIIALRNPFFEYFFEEMGDIGYLCENYDEMKAVLIGILNDKPVQRYQQQVANIIAERDKFSVENLGAVFKSVL